MSVARHGGAAGCPCPVEGLPPLPRGLSGILSSSGGSWRDVQRLHSKRARIQADISRGGGGEDAQAGGGGSGAGTPGGVDGALALLRKEMVGLRQLDMSLLSQLWSLHEAIQEIKGSSLLSDVSFTADNGYPDEGEEEEEDEEEDDEEEQTSMTPSDNSCMDQWMKDSLHIH